MNTAQYHTFTSTLKRHGYTYYPDQPYEGRNTWMKFLVKEEDRKAFIRIDEYRHENSETVATEYLLKPHGVVRDDSCDLHLTRSFADLDLNGMEQTVLGYYDKLFK